MLQAKPNKRKEGIQDIKSPEDLAIELAAAMDKDLDYDVPLPRPPFLTEVFPTGVPHMRYHRIVTLANENQVSEVAPRLWQNGRLVPKKLTTDCRVRFGVWGAGTEEDRQRAPREPVCTCGSLVAKWKCEVGAHLGLICALRCLCACLLCVLHAR